MLLIIVTTLLVAMFAAISYFFYWIDNDTCEILFEALFAIGLIALIVMIIIAFTCNVGINGKIAQGQARYDSLVYQLENELYENDNDIGKKELYNEIQRYNEDYKKGVALKDDIWLGAFYPDSLYDSLKPIILK